MDGAPGGPTWETRPTKKRAYYPYRETSRLQHSCSGSSKLPSSRRATLFNEPFIRTSNAAITQGRLGMSHEQASFEPQQWSRTYPQSRALFPLWLFYFQPRHLSPPYWVEISPAGLNHFSPPPLLSPRGARLFSRGQRIRRRAMTIPTRRWSMGVVPSATSSQAWGNCGGPAYPLVPMTRMAAACHSGRGGKVCNRLDVVNNGKKESWDMKGNKNGALEPPLEPPLESVLALAPPLKPTPEPPYGGGASARNLAGSPLEPPLEPRGLRLF